MRDDVDQSGAAHVPEPLRADTFRPFVASSVSVVGTGIALTLVRIEMGDPRSAIPGAREPFVLIFEGVRADRQGRGLLPEGLHRLAFRDDGAVHDVHVAPIQTHAPDCQHYQAVFN